MFTAGGFSFALVVTNTRAPSLVSRVPDHPLEIFGSADSLPVSESTTGLFASVHLYVISPGPRRDRYKTALAGGSITPGTRGPQAA